MIAGVAVIAVTAGTRVWWHARRAIGAAYRNDCVGPISRGQEIREEIAIAAGVAAE